MIFRCTKLFVPLLAGLLVTGLLAACSSSTSTSSDSGTDGGVTRVSMYATPSPYTAMEMDAGPKTVTSTEDDVVVINKAYLVIWSTTIETVCDDSFYAGLEKFLRNPLDMIVPPAHAHTTPTPTSTGEPHVIDILAADNTPVAIGSMSPSVADYCGVNVDMIAADADTLELPSDIDMVGRSLYIEATYSGGPSGKGAFVVDTSATLINRQFLLAALMMISADNPTDSITVGINYDTWFDGIHLGELQLQTTPTTELNSTVVQALLQNITASIHHLP